MIFIDTDVAIAFRDGDKTTQQRLIELGTAPVISIATRIELENGVTRDPARVDPNRRALDRILLRIGVELFKPADVLAYGDIVLAVGYDRRQTLDRLIAAQAIARDATLITRNGRDFRRIPSLKLDVWPPLAA